MRAIRAAFFFSICLVSSSRVGMAHVPFTKDAVQKAVNDGSFDERVNRIRSLEQHKMSEAMRQRAIYKIRRAQLQAGGANGPDAARTLFSGPEMAFPFTAQPELRPYGTVRTLTILFDFEDFRAATVLPNMTIASIKTNIYGTGTADAQSDKPYESVHSYYSRASEGKVDVQGNVLGWYHFPKKRSTYEPAKAPALPANQRAEAQAYLDNTAIFKMASEAITALNTNHDFAQYDNDGDGDIDLVTFIYAGPDTDWGSFWWAYRWQFFIPDAENITFDGKRLHQFVFEFASKRGPGGRDFDPKTLMHETGHAFGLADYYDYKAGDPSEDQDGGVGGLDMMDANVGNHNAFSRWLLDWTKPKVVGSGSLANYKLVASGSTQSGTKALAIFPGLANSSAPSQEMFIVENRHKVGNDAQTPGNGLLVWHVNATLNDDRTDFKYDNSYAPHKLLKLVRADSAADFGDGERASAGTYFNPGHDFTPASVPDSKGEDGSPTYIALDQIPAAAESVTVRLGFLPSTGAAPSSAIAGSPVSPNAPETTLAKTAGGPSASASSPATVASASEVSPESLTSAVQSLVNRAADAPVNLDDLETLDHNLSQASATDLKSIWEKIEKKKLSDKKNTAAWVTGQLVLTRWASKSGKAACEALLDTPEADAFVKATYPRVMEAWANNTPLKAGEWYLNSANIQKREVKSLDAGSSFTSTVFRQLQLANPNTTVKQLEKVQQTNEIVGAVEGIHEASKKLSIDVEKVSKDLQEVKNKPEVIHATIHFLEARDAVKDAASNIKDPKQRAEFNKAMESRSRP